MSEYVKKYDNLLTEFNDTKIFNKQLKENTEELKKLEQKHLDNKNELKDNDKMRYLETEEETAENISDIYEHRSDTRKKNDTRKKDDKYNINGLDLNGYNINGYNINGFNRNGFNRNGYNTNGYNINGLDINGYNINGKKNHNKYGFNKYGFNKNGLDKYGFNKNGFNKNGYDLYNKTSGEGLKISALPIFLSKAYTNNCSKKLISDIEQLINNLHDNKQIIKQVYNNLIKAITYGLSITF